MKSIDLPAPRKRYFLPKDFKITVWSRIKPYFNDLCNRPIESVSDLKVLIADLCELTDILKEDFNWRYINQSCNCLDVKAYESYTYAIEEIQPKVEAIKIVILEKILHSSFLDQLSTEDYRIYLRNIKNERSLFNKHGAYLKTVARIKSIEYGKIMSEAQIESNKQKFTLFQAKNKLLESDRNIRESIYLKIQDCRNKYAPQLEDLFDDLVEIRQEIAHHSHFDNYRDYRFKELARFSYTAEDCTQFHKTVASEVVPIVDEIHQLRKKYLNVDQLRPWDIHLDLFNQGPLKGCSSTEELSDKTIQCLSNIHPKFGDYLSILKQMDRLDLEDRQWKRPGAYNMPLPMSGVSFIFLNAAAAFQDNINMLHESGHAIHSFLYQDKKLSTAQELPKEITEFAAMSIELLSMQEWGIFVADKATLRRAKISKLIQVIELLPWIATIDKFQHWIYTNPGHTREERMENWKTIFFEFQSPTMDWSGLEQYLERLWHKQIHIFEKPLFYIEFGIAQLGAIALWKAHLENPDKSIKQFIAALELGYSKPVKEIYQEAGIAFDFSADYIRSLLSFVKKELDKLILENV